MASWRKSVAKTFEDLVIWQKARHLAGDVIALCEQPHLRQRWAVKDQLVSASISIMNNIAEGFERGGNREFKHFLAQAKGSAGEVRSMLYLLLDAEWIPQSEFDELRGRTLEIGSGIHRFIRHLRVSEYDGINRREDEIRDADVPNSLEDLSEI
jgi:four helix bundle protein